MNIKTLSRDTFPSNSPGYLCNDVVMIILKLYIHQKIHNFVFSQDVVSPTIDKTPILAELLPRISKKGIIFTDEYTTTFGTYGISSY